VVAHPHLLATVSVDLKVSQVKYIIKRITDNLRVVMTNARDTNMTPETRQHYLTQQHLIAELIVTLQNALDRETPREPPTD